MTLVRPLGLSGQLIKPTLTVTGSYLVVRTVSDLLLGVLESCSWDGGTFSLSVLQKQVGTQLLPLHLAGTIDIYLNMKKRSHIITWKPSQKR